MDYTATKYWIKGYVDALEKCENITKEHLEDLISKIQDIINQVEESQIKKGSEIIEIQEHDDLPF